MGNKNSPGAITAGIAGSAPLTTVTQKISNTCNKHVTPAPNSAIGTIDYYYDEKKANSTAPWLSRHFDFINRHKSCKHTVPEYYLGYGNKYIRKFTNELSPKLSDAGKAWLIEARRLLQKYMEDGFVDNVTKTKIITPCKAYPKASATIKTATTESLELDSDNFKTFAFGTHPAAYIDAGLGNLSLADLARIGLTPDFKEWFGADSWAQLGEILRYLGHDKITKLQKLSDKTLEELKRAGIRVADNIIQQGIEAAKREIGRQFDNIFRFPFLPRLF